MTITANFTNAGGSAIALESYSADTGETFAGAETAAWEVAPGDFARIEAAAANATDQYAPIAEAPNETAFYVEIQQRTQGGGGGPKNGIAICHDGAAAGGETCIRAWIDGFGQLWLDEVTAGTVNNLAGVGVSGYDETVMQALRLERTVDDHFIVSYAGVQQLDQDLSASPPADGQITLYGQRDDGASQEWGSLTSNATTGSVGQTVAVGQAVETDIALGASALRTVAVGQAQEADSALGVSNARIVAVGQALETDTALGVTTLSITSATDPVGVTETLTIQGTGLDAATDVRINGVSHTIATQSATEITVTVQDIDALGTLYGSVQVVVDTGTATAAAQTTLQPATNNEYVTLSGYVANEGDDLNLADEVGGMEDGDQLEIQDPTGVLTLRADGTVLNESGDEVSTQYRAGDASDDTWTPWANLTLLPGLTVETALAVETSQALGVSAVRSRAVSQAAAADSALAVTARRDYLVGQAVEADSALAASAAGQQQVAVGLALEADESLAAAVMRAPAVGLAAEADTALAAGAGKARAAGQAIEVDSAFAVAAAGSVTVGQAQETTTALAATATRSVAAGLAQEAATALGAGSSKRLGIGFAPELDAALRVQASTQFVVGTGQALEGDSAMGVGAGKVYDLALGVESDSALAAAAQQTSIRRLSSTGRNRVRMLGRGN